jgi:hypothetical protein
MAEAEYDYQVGKKISKLIKKIIPTIRPDWSRYFWMGISLRSLLIRDAGRG